MSVETANGPAQDTTSSQRRGVVPNIVSWVLIGLFGLSVATLVYALRSETMRPDFRLLTVSFLYLMGVSQAGVVFCAITRLVRAQWAKPYYRLAELSTLAFFPFASATFLLIYVYARDELFHWLPNHSLTNGAEAHASPWLNSQLVVDPESLRPVPVLWSERTLCRRGVSSQICLPPPRLVRPKLSALLARLMLAKATLAKSSGNCISCRPGSLSPS